MEQWNHRFQIARVKRGDRVFSLRSDDTLELNDFVLAVGLPQDLKILETLLGKKTQAEIPESEESQSRWVMISSRAFIGKHFGSMEIFRFPVW